MLLYRTQPQGTPKIGILSVVTLRMKPLIRLREYAVEAITSTASNLDHLTALEGHPHVRWSRRGVITLPKFNRQAEISFI